MPDPTFDQHAKLQNLREPTGRETTPAASRALAMILAAMPQETGPAAIVAQGWWMEEEKMGQQT